MKWHNGLVVALEIQISREPDVRIHEQVAAQIVLHIGSGALRPGDALPSVRALARRLHIHRNTVTSAYRDPVLTKLVVRRPGNQLVVRDPQSRQAEVGNGLGEFVDSTIRAARQRGYSLKELSGRLRDRLLAAPPDHIPVLSDDVGMQVLISAELSARFSMPIHTCSAADLLADPDRLLGALLVSPPGDIPTLEAVIPAERPAISMIYSSAVDHASRIRRLDHPSLIVVASISEYFLEMARGVLAPAVAIGHSIRSLLISGGPLAALGAADLIFCDYCAHPVVRSARPKAEIIRHQLISPSCLDQIQAAVDSRAWIQETLE